MTMTFPLARRIGLALLIGIGSAAAGCGSTAVHYHTLVAPGPAMTAEPRTPAAVPAAGPGPIGAFELQPVGVPAALAQTAFVIRTGPSQVDIVDSERWVTPLDEELRQALSSRLANRLDSRDVAGLPRIADRPVVRIKVQVRQFDTWPGDRIQLVADWTLTGGAASAPLALTCSGRFDGAAARDYPALVRAQQALVTALADRIASDIRRGLPGGPDDCVGPAPG